MRAESAHLTSLDQSEVLNVVMDTIRVFGKVALELYAFDRQDWTRFRTGINEITMSLDGTQQFQQRIEKLSFARGRDFYNYIDYEELYENGKRVHKLYIDDGNKLDLFKTNGDRGFLSFDEECDSTIEIKLFDSYRNESTLRIPIKCEKPSRDLERILDREGPYQIVNSILVFPASHDNMESDETALFYANGQ